MTVNVDLVVPVPADTDTYNLVADLTALRSGILDSLGDVIVELQQRPENGGAADFTTLTCTSTGIFGSSVAVNSSDGGSALVLSNSLASFGLEKSGVAQFKYGSGKWYSNVPIRVGNGTAPDDAANIQYVTSRENIINASINTVQNNVNSLESRTVSRWNGNQLWAPNANYANSAGYAGSAGSAPVGSHDHNSQYAPIANRPETFAGTTGNVSVPARGEANLTLTLPKVGAYPAFLGLTVIDINGDEVFASVRAGWTTPHQPPIRLKNVSAGSETVRVQWMAIY